MSRPSSASAKSGSGTRSTRSISSTNSSSQPTSEPSSPSPSPSPSISTSSAPRSLSHSRSHSHSASQSQTNLAVLSDSEDEANVKGDSIRVQNRIGKGIPLEWYADEDHIGYNIAGNKLLRKSTGSRLDNLLSRLDDPAFNRKIYDEVNDQWIELTPEEFQMIQNIRRGGFAYGKDEFDPYQDYDRDYYTNQIRHEILGNAQEPKRRFIPSKWEAKRVVKLVHAIKNGWLKTEEQRENEKKLAEEKAEGAYLVWGQDGSVIRDPNDPKSGLHRMPASIPPPKPSLPGHAASYNPPEEYLLTDAEAQEMMDLPPEDRKYDFLPRKFGSFRELEAYQNSVKDRFERCLDLYLCPRTRRKKLNIDPESLIPQLPKASDLKPFPHSETVIFKGHSARVRSISFSPDGQWLASAGDDASVKLWETETGRCWKTWKFGLGDDGTQSTEESKEILIEHVEWNPNSALPIIAVAVGQHIVLLLSPQSTESQRAAVQKLFAEEIQSANDNSALNSHEKRVQWQLKVEKQGKIRNFIPLNGDRVRDNENSDDETEENKNHMKLPSIGPEESPELILSDIAANSSSSLSLILTFHHLIKHISWHLRGDYFSSISLLNQNSSQIFIHRLSMHQSNSPFPNNKNGGLIMKSLFHPNKPFFILCTRRHIRLYNLQTQLLMKRLLTPAKWLSAMAIHPSGDHILCSSFDRKLCWFDLDGGDSPYKVLRFHSKAIRSVDFHSRFPLFVSASDDGSLHVFHSTVYADLLTNPLIVPLKIIKCHEADENSGLGILDCKFHPKQPWVATAGADHLIKLFT